MAFIAPIPLIPLQRPIRSLRLKRRPLYRSRTYPICSGLALERQSSKDQLVSAAPDIFQQSLNLLEWPLVTAYVLRFASTDQGRRALGTPSGLYIPSTQHQSKVLLSQTRAAYYLEYVLSRPLDFIGVRDVTESIDLAAKGLVLTGRQLVDIATTLRAARRVRRHIDSIANVSSGKVDALSDLVSSFRTWPDVEKGITTHLDEYGDVQESADPQLRGIRNSLKDTMSDIRVKLNDIMTRHADAVQDRVITSRYDRFVIPVKTTHKAVFRSGIVHDASSTGSTAYIEPMSIKALNDRMRQLAAQEKARVHAILSELSLSRVAPIADDVRNLDSLLGELDAAVARARCSKSLDASDVVFNDEHPLRLLGVRHPILSWKAMAESSSQKEETQTDGNDLANGRYSPQAEPVWKQKVVPTDYVLNDDIRCVCITGPNTGGKTLTLKTIGVSVLMAKAGLFVPSTLPKFSNSLSESTTDQSHDEEFRVSRIPFFDAVLADIGDDQSLVQSLSTFSGHVTRIMKILAASTPRTLVLLDEIGSGTDPAEGAALGMAVLRHLAINRRAALTIATTHHGELKTLKYAADDSARFFENASVEFDDVKMAPTYKLVWGIPGRSNALAIAERLGMIPEILEEARFLLRGSSETEDGSKQVDIEKMISCLERDKLAAEVARGKSEKAVREIETMKLELQDRLERLRTSELELRREQRIAMDAEMKEARKQIAKVIKEMQQGGGSAQAAAKASERLRTMVVPGPAFKGVSHGQIQARGSPVKTADELKIGDRLVVPGLGANEVQVVSLVSKKEVLVAMGPMKVKIKVSEITDVNQDANKCAEIRKVQPRSRTGGERKQMSVMTAANTIDIRGERVDGAEAKVDRALDKALVMGSLWVIHGHGTGRLRNGIRNFLSNHHLVERIEDAEQADGGSGVTIAYLA